MSTAEPPWLRRAGSGRLADGSVVTWSVAEGARGRRWRWTLADETGLRHAGLVELDTQERFARLELATGEGVFTLHPDPDRLSAHGNVVRAGGVTPIELAWSDGDGVALEDDAFASALTGGQGRGWSVGRDLAVRRDDRGKAATLAPALDDRGIPRLADAREWPLET